MSLAPSGPEAGRRAAPDAQALGGPPAQRWRLWAGPALVVALGVAHALADRTGHAPTDPGELYLASVVVATFLGGMSSGFGAVALAAVFYVAVSGPRLPFGSIAFHLALIALVVPVVGLVDRTLRRAGDARMRRVATLKVLGYYRTLLEDLGTLVWEFSIEQERLTYISESVTRVLGYPPERWLTEAGLWRQVMHPDDMARTLELNTRAWGGEGERQFEHRVIAADGRTVWLHTALRGGLDAAGRPVVRGVALDITAHRRAQAELGHTLSLLLATLDSTTDGVLVVDLEGRITNYNRKFVDMWRLPEEVLRARDDALAVSLASRQLVDPDQFQAKIRELYADTEASSFDVLELADGRQYERFSQPQRIDGQSVGRVWSFRDVTGRVRAERALRLSEEQLRHAQKMEAVGELAGGVAHDFNNILTAVMGNLSLILDDAAASPAIRERARDIEIAAERAASLTRQLLAFSRRQMLELRVVDMNEVVGEMQKLLRVTLGESVELVLLPSPSVATVRVDRGQIEQVVLNLALNARDAMPRGGRLEIAARVMETEGDRARLTPPYHAGRHVQLTVRDSGAGMDPETLSRIFEPFFTTKERGKGTGLGLAVAYGIVRQSGGSIFVQSEPGQGTTFDIYLPFSPESVHPGETAPPPGDTTVGEETVLVAEDEPAVRTLMRKALLRAGYRVLEAASGSDALEAATSHPERLHLLVSDVVMPGMSGFELAERLQNVRPELRVLFISGYADITGLEGDPPVRATHVLWKPFAMDTLVRRVRETLDSPVT